MKNSQENCIQYYQRAWYSPAAPLSNEFGNQFPNTKLPRERRIELYQRYKAGETANRLSTQYGLSVSRVRSIITQFNKVYCDHET